MAGFGPVPKVGVVPFFTTNGDGLVDVQPSHKLPVSKLQSAHVFVVGTGLGTGLGSHE